MTQSPLLCCRLGVWCGVVHAALIPFIPISLATLCPCCNFTILTPADLEQHHTTHWGKVGKHLFVLPLIRLSLSLFLKNFFSRFLSCFQTHTHTSTQIQSILTRGIFCHEIETQLGYTLNSRSYRFFTPSYTPRSRDIHTSIVHVLPIWLVKSLMAYSSTLLSVANVGFYAEDLTVAPQNEVPFRLVKASCCDPCSLALRHRTGQPALFPGLRSSWAAMASPLIRVLDPHSWQFWVVWAISRVPLFIFTGW